jgi:cytochrome c5
MKTLALVAMTSAASIAIAQTSMQSTPTAKPAPVAIHAAPKVNEGQRVFEQNCSRCHNPPDGFSPRISSTVVRHMRVRANLSEEDARALMKFFHP